MVRAEKCVNDIGNVVEIDVENGVIVKNEKWKSWRQTIKRNGYSLICKVLELCWPNVNLV